MATNTRRQAVLLGVLVAVLLVVAWWNFIVPAAPLAPPIAGSAPRGPAGAVRAPASVPGQVEPLHLARLTTEKPEPEGGERDPFRFGERSAASPQAQVEQPAMAAAPQPQAPTGPPPPPPITLKFIGLVDTSDQRKIAVLSDGQNVSTGGKGKSSKDVTASSASVPSRSKWPGPMATGRQVIRLSGS